MRNDASGSRIPWDIYTIFACGVDEIATNIRNSATTNLLMLCLEVHWEDVQGLTGLMDMLTGFYNHGMFPVEKARKESVALWSSRFGTGLMLAGRRQKIVPAATTAVEWQW